MKKLLIAFLALGLVVGFGVAQDDAKQDHSEHSEEHKQEDGEMDHSDSHNEDDQTEMDHEDHSDEEHGDMDHSDHGDMSEMGQALNVVLVGDSSLTLEPLISIDGTLTLGVKVEPPADLSLKVKSPSGQEMMPDAVPVMAMGMEESHEGEHSEEGEEHSEDEDHSEGESDHSEGHHSEEAEGKHNGEHDMDSMKADITTTLSFEIGAVEEGVWRFSGTLDGADVSFPLSIYKASTEQTDVYLALAPSPALSTRGLSEAFVYAFRDGEVVHNGMTLNRSMEGMQHSTDDEQLMLTHNHFNDVYNDILGYGPMANNNPLGFSMAGDWDVNLMIMGANEEMLSFDIEVLDE